MNVILFCREEQQLLLPLTYTKPAAALRMGILTFKERWDKILNTESSYLTDYYLSTLYPIEEQPENIFIHASYFPTPKWVDQIKSLKPGQAIYYKGHVIAFCGSLEKFYNQEISQTIEYKEDLLHIQRPYHLFSYNHLALDFDYKLLTEGRTSAPISDTNGVINPENIFLEEGAKVEFAILNASNGPIYIGNNAEVCEGSLVRGGLALCNHAKLNLGTKIYGATTIGPWCKVGGEVNNSILTAYSNKGHDGFLGNSVIGEWCNLGADTNNSNLKNNYSEVKLWDYNQESYIKTGLQFCGLIMGDHSKSAINTQFNTGTVTGVFANVFYNGFPPNHIKSFTWGGGKESPKFNLEAAYQVAERMMERRNVTLTPAIKQLIDYLYTHAR